MGWILFGCIVLRGGCGLLVAGARRASQLVDKTLASQRARVRQGVIHGNRSLRQAERSITRPGRQAP